VLMCVAIMHLSVILYGQCTRLIDTNAYILYLKLLFLF
jgi:hypothetical protein